MEKTTSVFSFWEVLTEPPRFGKMENMRTLTAEELTQLRTHLKVSLAGKSEEAERKEWSRILREVEATEEELSTPEWQEALKYLAEH